MGSLQPVRAIAKREWSSYFNSPVAYVFIMIFLALAGFFTFAVSRFYEANQADLRFPFSAILRIRGSKKERPSPPIRKTKRRRSVSSLP